VKERLVGAAVLMAAAIILIPEMLSGPDRPGAAATRAAAGETSIKTYTIDLSATPGTQAAARIEDNRTPPPEDSAPAAQPTPAAPQANPEFSTAPITAPADETPVAEVPAPAPERVEPRPSEPPVSQPPTPARVASPAAASPSAAAPPPAAAPSKAQPLASTPRAPTSAGWVVQVGSFSKQATAERLMRELRSQNRDAFVMPVRSGGATLYRVRIGPFKERAAADTALRAVKMPGATVVAHP
jgi:DedD protein